MCNATKRLAVNLDDIVSTQRQWPRKSEEQATRLLFCGLEAESVFLRERQASRLSHEKIDSPQ